MFDQIEFLSLPESPPAYEIRDLGLLPEGRLCHAFAINSQTSIVGEADMEFGLHAFLWQNGQITDLGPSSSISSKAISINESGYILGTVELTPGSDRISCLWSSEKLINLSGLGISGAGAKAINNDNFIVGEMHFGDYRAPNAFLWKYGQTIELVSPFVGGSSAEAINNLGQAAGFQTSLQLFDQAFFWSENKLIDLGIGRAYGINDNAVTAGLTYQAKGLPIACLWENFRRRELPLPQGFISSKASAINNGMEVVGTLTANDGRKAAFLWKNEYSTDLNNAIDQTIGWDLQEANAINESGQIVGWGFLEHRHHGFLLTPSDRSSAQIFKTPPLIQTQEMAAPPIPKEPAALKKNPSFEELFSESIRSEIKR